MFHFITAIHSRLIYFLMRYFKFNKCLGEQTDKVLYFYTA
jgi:hypothetical protein